MCPDVSLRKNILTDSLGPFEGKDRSPQLLLAYVYGMARRHTHSTHAQYRNCRSPRPFRAPSDGYQIPTVIYTRTGVLLILALDSFVGEGVFSPIVCVRLKPSD